MRGVRIECAAAAASLVIGAYVHFEIWRHEYRHAPVREMFLAQVGVALVIAVLLVVTAARPAIVSGLGTVSLLAGMLLAEGSLVAFAVSRGPGVPTLHGNFKEHGIETTASYVGHLGSAKTILVAETAAALLCGVALLQRRYAESAV